MPSRAAQGDDRDLLMARLEEHAGKSKKDIDLIKFFVVAMDYVARFNHCGAVIMPGQRYYRQDGTEHTFEDVPFPKILEAVESRIGGLKPPGQRMSVFERVMEGIERGPNAQLPKWAEPPPNPNKDPTSPWSISKAPEGEAKTNAELIDALAAAAGLNDQQAASLGAQITWWDGSAGGNSCSITFSSPPKVGIGRLGRDHTLDDVPNNYVRDCLIDYIATQIKDKAVQRAAEQAVFSDLTAQEIVIYSLKQQELKKIREAEDSIPIAPPRRLSRLEQALESIQRVDLSSCFVFAVGTRDYDRSPPMRRSVVYPGRMMLDDEEEDFLDMRMHGQVGIGFDCDQVRTMVKLFIRQEGWEWSIEDFRAAIEVTRPQLLAFLEGKGPAKGKSSLAYQRSWEFFERRTEMGLYLEDEAEEVVLSFDSGSDDGAECGNEDTGEGRERDGDGDEVEEKDGDPATSGREARILKRLEQALSAVDPDKFNSVQNLQPVGQRDYNKIPPMRGSVLEPGSKVMLPQEAARLSARPLDGVEKMFLNCDQVRAFVHLLVRGGGKWTIEQFRHSVGLSRLQLITFLEGKGPTAGGASAAYQLCWEFLERWNEMDLADNDDGGVGALCDDSDGDEDCDDAGAEGGREGEGRAEAQNVTPLITSRSLHPNNIEEMRTAGEQRNIAKLAHVLSLIDPNSVDLAPSASPVANRDYYRLPAMWRSVIEPGNKPQQPEEKAKLSDWQREGVEPMHFGSDQVRALVKLFVRDTEWTVEDVRQAAGLSRDQMIAFLGGKGPHMPGRPSAAYQMCWEFLERRRKLGLFKMFKLEEGRGLDEDGDEDMAEDDGRGGHRRASARTTRVHLDHNTQPEDAYEAYTLKQLETALAAINPDGIDLTPNKDTTTGVERNFQLIPRISRSVLKRGIKTPMATETWRPSWAPALKDLVPITMNCDQVRASISILVKKGGWTIEQFRFALDISRHQLTDFLERKGPSEGKETVAYQLCWEFFDRRREIGIPIDEFLDFDDMGESPGSKRRREQGGGDSPAKKRARRSARRE